MDGATHFNFAFNINNIAFAELYAGRNSVRPPEYAVANHRDGKAVYLPLLFAFSIDKDIIAINGFLDLIFQATGPVNFLLDCFFNIGELNNVVFMLLRPVIRFNQKVNYLTGFCG